MRSPPRFGTALRSVLRSPHAAQARASAFLLTAATVGLTAACSSSEPEAARFETGDDPTDPSAATDGGSSDDGAVLPSPDAATPITGPVAADEAAKALCAVLDTCAVTQVSDAFPSTASCIERMRLRNLIRLDAPGSSLTPAHLVACSKAMLAAPCSEHPWEEALPACKILPGSRADGESCRWGEQCQGKGCIIPPGGTCGTCGPMLPLGSACTAATQCADGLHCYDGKCAARQITGEPCNGTTLRCGYDECREGLCVTHEGKSCGGMSDCYYPYFCSKTTKKCIMQGWTTVGGGACGFHDDGAKYSECRALATCDDGECNANAADGADCSNEHPCLFPAACVDGTCVLANGACTP